ncbi:DUF4157 domain-containing protein [Streptomyces sp. LRE541]|uniref:eCIS core domain-containing protein n=1 Tax=Streptomyces sp. LRE541 TaxID=2931983 RepID=UPI00200FE1AD|nr:DUF4157 domain-containing protein [Streptomyces sp. LRE541]UPZ32236.1 DUF4157 domain-containing protein [Streptomyces sp. LRE541]
MTASAAQDAQAAEQAAAERRRKRKERAAKNRAPEPKNIVGGAGQPLDPGVRRELEEQLGHDLGSVRLHTDRDAGALTGLLGADAVAVGQDIFFGEGRYQPGTEQGRALLAHELLHTIQHPYANGALTVGRDLGQVSAPHEAAERAAEDTAQAVARGEQAPDIAPEAGTPAWMRYTTVDADRNRLERLDPATLVDRLANTVVRSLRNDPTDSAQRVRASLAPLSEELQERVLDRLEHRLLTFEHDFVVDLVTEIDEAGRAESEVTARLRGLLAPEVEEDTAGDVRAEREKEQEAAEEEQRRTERAGPAPGPEKEDADTEGVDAEGVDTEPVSAAGSTPENAGRVIPQGGTPGTDTGKYEDERKPGPRTGGDASSPRGDGEQPASPAGRAEQKPGRQEGAAGGKAGAQAAGKQAGKSGAEQSGGQKSGAQKSGAETSGQRGSQGQQQDKGKQGGDRAEAKQAEEKAKKEAGQEEAQGPRAGAGDEAAARARESAAATEAARKDEPARDEGTPTAAGRDEGFPARSGTLDGIRAQDQEDEEEREESVGQGGDSEVEVGGGEASAWDIKLRPEDFLPEQDLDVSNVPTSDQVDEPAANSAPPTPTFPAPPPTRADLVHARREQEDQEDAEREAAAERDDPGTEDSPPVPGAEEEAAEQDRRTESELDPWERSEPRPAPGVASKDPKQGDDPKAGPVAAEVTAQEAKDRSKETGGNTAEQAAKEEKGTPTAGGPGDRTSGGGKDSAQARSDTSAAASPSDSAQKGAESATGAAKAEESPGPQESKGPKDQGGIGTSDGSASDGGTTDSDSPADTETTPSPSPTAGQPSSEANNSPASPRSSSPRTEEPKEPAPQQEDRADSGVDSGAGSGGGGDSGSRSASTVTRGGGGGGSTGGGKGSTPKGKKASKAAPNLSGVSPEEGLAAASNLKPHQAVEAMDSVGGAVDKDVGKEHSQLAARPPAMERPSGAPRTLHGAPESDEAARYNEDKATRAEDAKDEKAEVKGEKKPEGKIDAEEMEEPDFFDQVGMMAGYVIGGIGDWLGFDVTAEDLAAQFAGMPTKDEAMKEAQNGTAPGVDMKGQAEDKTQEQGGNTDDKSQEAAGTGADDAGRRMGEDQIYPDAPKERLEGKVPAEQGGRSQVGGGGASTGAVPPEAASEVAEHERKPQFKQALSDGRQDMGRSREKKAQDTRTSQDRHKRQVDKEVLSNTREQTGKRAGVLTDVDKQRSDWTKEQDEELKKLGTKKSDREKKIRDDVEKEEEDTDKDVGKEKETSDKDIEDTGSRAEEEAEKKKDEDVDDSKGWLSKTLDWIKEKFIALRDKVVQIIKDARAAIVEALKNFKETVEGWINAAREGIVEMIRKFIEDLIEFVTSLVEAVIEIARRIRKFIADLIKAAIALVNRLAATLRQIMNDLLESIAKLLSDILNVLKKMLLDVLKACKEALKAVLDFATKFIAAFGEFMMILVDILSDPGGWLSGAKNSAYDGAKNHLFNEVKSAVKQWFNDKVKEITGLTEAVWNKLMKGGWTLEKIAKEVWDAIVPQLPFIIGEIVITKVLAKLIPGAGWGAAILEAIQAAIGSLGEILKAIGAVITWLKSVRQGGAGVLFAKAIAAGIVVLLEMAYELLLSGIGKYVSKVGRRLKGVAAKIGTEKTPGGDKGKDGQGGGGDGKGGDKDAPATSTTAPSPRQSATPSPARRPDLRKPRPGPDKPKDQAAPAKPKDKETPIPSSKPTKPKGPTSKTDKTDKTDTTNKPEGKNNTPSNNSTKPTPPTSKDKNGKPKDKDQRSDKDKQDTKPTPPAKPKQDPGKKDGSDGTKKDDNKGDQDKSPNPDNKRPDPDSKKDPSDKDSPGRKDTDGEGKGRKDPDSDGKDGKGGKGGKDDKRAERDKRDDPDLRDRRDKRKKEEKDSKDKQLDEIVARIRRILKKRLEPGIPRGAHLELLTALRRHYRLAALSLMGGPEFNIYATLNPTKHVITANEDGLADYLKRHTLPRPDENDFKDGDTPTGFVRDFINPGWAEINGEEAPGGDRKGILGWSHIISASLQSPHTGAYYQWDAMHLLPRELGGPKDGSNFVPAYHHINKPWYNKFERVPAKKFGSQADARQTGHVPGRYAVSLDLYDGARPGVGYPDDKYPPGFPDSMTTSWAVYKRESNTTGEERGHWNVDESDSKTVQPDFGEPPIGRPAIPNINTGDRKSVEAGTGLPTPWVDAILDLRVGQKFTGIDDLKRRLQNYKIPQGLGLDREGRHLLKRDRYLKRLTDYRSQGRFTITI